MIRMKQLLSEFYELLDQNIQKTWSVSDHSGHLLALTNTLQAFCQKVVHLGDYAFLEDSQEEISQDDRVSKGLIHYRWMSDVKSHLILWRDVIFQFQKTLIIKNEDDLSESEIADLKKKSREVITLSATHIKGCYDIALAKILDSNQSKEAFLEEQKLRLNPWPVFKEQINTIESQSHSLYDQFELILRTAGDIQKIKQEVGKVMHALELEIKRLEHLANETIAVIERDDDTHQKIIRHIDAIEEQAVSFNYYNTYNYSIDQLTASMCEEVKVAVNLDENRIPYKVIDFANSTRLWLHGAIQPQMRESQELIDSVGNSMKMTLINIRNRASIISNKPDDKSEEIGFKLDFIQSLESLLASMTQIDSELRDYKNTVVDLLNKKLNIKFIYDQDHNFLDASPQYVISHLRLDQSAWIEKIRSWIVGRAQFARGFMANVAVEESLSTSEKIVRFVKSRNIDDHNLQYTNIFSTYGYIGESFWVGRKAELSHITELIDNWKEGFRGSVLISGRRFSGKTVFGELVAHRYFLQNVLRIRPFSSLKVNGRSLEITDDIEAAFNFIKKHTISEPYLIWIDDLELWQSTHIQASKNVQTLIRNIDALSPQFFFIVSMSNWYKEYFDRMLDIRKVFQTEINMDFMPEEDIRKALMIRHGATHKILVDNEGNEVFSQDFSQMVHNINHEADNNIGDALNLWSYFTKKVDEERVTHTPDHRILLPEFLNRDNAVVLRAVLMNKRTNEYRLRKSFGRVFTEKYSPIIMRLINLGVLKRHMDGLLEVNEGIVNPVAALLGELGYIKYK